MPQLKSALAGLWGVARVRRKRLELFGGNVVSETLYALTLGAAEASISAGLLAMGVDESSAFAIALTHRLCTFYLPPIWGYASLRWLRRGGYV